MDAFRSRKSDFKGCKQEAKDISQFFLMKTDNKSVRQISNLLDFIVGTKNCVVVRDNISKMKN